MHVDLREGLPKLSRHESTGTLVVLWAGAIPLGQLEVAPGRVPMTLSWLRELVASAVAPAVGQRLLGSFFDPKLPERRSSRRRPVPPEGSDVATLTGPMARVAAGAAVAGERSSVSVVVCTRDRPDQLRGTLSALRRLPTQPDEVVVVDNAPTGLATRDVVGDYPGVRYILEPRPGLSIARNTGVRATQGDLIAFTDDDARPVKDWVARVAAAFTEPDVLAVTGLVLPSVLETEGELAFERHLGGFGQGYGVRIFDLAFFDGMRSRGVPVWKIGAGANMALRREVFDLVGMFDERLGAGAAGCSEDSELWYRILADGWRCRYDPAAVVLHEHRVDLRAVQEQARLYLRGHVAALFAQFALHRDVGNLRRAFTALPIYYAGRLRGTAGSGSAADPTVRAEVAGYLAGLARLGWAFRPAGTPRGRADRRPFLRQNPFPHPYTDGFYFREKMRAIHRIAPKAPPRRVLEVGGGQSGLTSMLYPAADVVSVDLEPAYGAAAVNRRERQVFVAADATRLPFPDGTFDVVTFFDVLEHIPDDGAAVREARRVLADRGSILVTAPNDRWRFPYHAVLRPLCPPDAELMAEWGHVRRGYSIRELDALIAAPVLRTATFINPVTAVNHDLAFSRLPARLHRALAAAAAPLVWAAYTLHRPGWPGTETAAWWRLAGVEGDRQPSMQTR